MRYLYIILFVLIVSTLSAQTIATPTVYCSTGGTGSVNSNFIVDYTVGECMITTIDTLGSNILTQGFEQPLNDSAIHVGNPDTLLGIFTGLTPNGDNKNDIWFIGGIDTLPNNTVYIYNRWGELLWKGDHYDNVKVVFEGKNTMGQDVVSGTYFYTIILNDKKKNYAGWIELSR